MTRRREPDEFEWALAMRLAGYSLAAISDRTGIPVRSLSRHFKSTSATKGKARKALARKALRTLLSDPQSADAVRKSIAIHMADEMAATKAMRDKLAEAVDALDVSTHEMAIQTCRALASAGTAYRNTQFVFQAGVGGEVIEANRATNEIPALIICEMTQEEIEAVRAKQRLDYGDPGAGDDLAD